MLPNFYIMVPTQQSRIWKLLLVSLMFTVVGCVQVDNVTIDNVMVGGVEATSSPAPTIGSEATPSPTPIVESSPAGYFDVNGTNESNVDTTMRLPIDEVIFFGTFSEASYISLTEIFTETVSLEYAVARNSDSQWTVYSERPIEPIIEPSQVVVSRITKSNNSVQLLESISFPVTHAATLEGPVNGAGQVSLEDGVAQIQASTNSDLNGITAKYIYLSVSSGHNVKKVLIIYELTTAVFGDPGTGGIFSITEYCNDCGCSCWGCGWVLSCP